MVSGGLQRLLALFACLTWTIVHGKEWTGACRGINHTLIPINLPKDFYL